MEQAIKLVFDGMSIIAAARKAEVPRTTLLDRDKEKYGSVAGRPLVQILWPVSI